MKIGPNKRCVVDGLFGLEFLGTAFESALFANGVTSAAPSHSLYSRMVMAAAAVAAATAVAVAAAVHLVLLALELSNVQSAQSSRRIAAG